MPPSAEDLALTALNALQPGDPIDPRTRAQDVLISYLRTTDPDDLEGLLVLGVPQEIEDAFKRAEQRCGGWTR